MQQAPFAFSQFRVEPKLAELLRCVHQVTHITEVKFFL